MVRDYISELINNIKTGSKAGNKTVIVPYSKLILAIAESLKSVGFVVDIEKKGKKIIKFLEITLNPEKPVEGAQRISKLSKRIYRGSDGVKTHARMNGYYFLTTPKGILTHVEARKQNVGGELLFKIW